MAPRSAGKEAKSDSGFDWASAGSLSPEFVRDADPADAVDAEEDWKVACLLPLLPVCHPFRLSVCLRIACLLASPLSCVLRWLDACCALCRVDVRSILSFA